MVDYPRLENTCSTLFKLIDMAQNSGVETPHGVAAWDCQSSMGYVLVKHYLSSPTDPVNAIGST